MLSLLIILVVYYFSVMWRLNKEERRLEAELERLNRKRGQ